VSIGGNTLVSGTLSVNNNLNVGNDAYFNTNVSVLSNVYIGGALSVLSNLYVSGNEYVGGTLSVMSNLLVSSNEYVGGTLSVASNLYCGNEAYFSTNVSIGNSLNVVSNVSVGGEIFTRSRFRTSVGYVDPEIGDLKMNVSPIERNGWLRCDGRAISRSAYASLFAIIGTTFGSGDSFSTFNLPNASDRIVGNAGSSHSVGQVVGSETTSLTSSNLPSHTHSGATSSNGYHTHGITDPGHTHTQTTINDDFNNSGGNPPGFTGDSAGTRTWSNISSSTTGITINGDGTHSHTFTTDGGSGLNGSAFNIMQPTLFIGHLFIFGGV
jgi:microcystin-dependent protein